MLLPFIFLNCDQIEFCYKRDFFLLNFSYKTDYFLTIWESILSNLSNETVYVRSIFSFNEALDSNIFGDRDLLYKLCLFLFENSTTVVDRFICLFLLNYEFISESVYASISFLILVI